MSFKQIVYIVVFVIDVAWFVEWLHGRDIKKKVTSWFAFPQTVFHLIALCLLLCWLATYRICIRCGIICFCKLTCDFLSFSRLLVYSLSFSGVHRFLFFRSSPSARNEFTHATDKYFMYYLRIPTLMFITDLNDFDSIFIFLCFLLLLPCNSHASLLPICWALVFRGVQQYTLITANPPFIIIIVIINKFV